MNRRSSLGNPVPAPLAFAVLALACVFLVSTSAPAQNQADPAQTELSKKEQKERAREERIAEYLRKKEEKRARRAQELEELEEQTALEIESSQTPPVAPEQTEAAPPPAIKKVKLAPRSKPGKGLPRDLARAQAAVRRTDLGEDPTVQSYLEMIDQQMASPYQLAAFGNFIGQNGMVPEALEYYRVALRIEKNDPLLHINFGTLHRQNDNLGAAMSAYEEAIAIAPNNAFAHYNLGTVLDLMGNYDGAVEEYRVALSIDPALGDPAQNPQAGTNDLLVAVKLMLFREQSGAMGLPLVDIPVEKIRAEVLEEN